VAIVRNVKDVSWKGAKAMMTSPNFLNELLEFNADEITEKQIRSVKDIHFKNKNKKYI
jgi:dynein heavy chain